MKISDMSRYGIRVFRDALDLYKMCLVERDFMTLVASTWCRVQHFEVIYSIRGSQMAGGHLKLDPSWTLFFLALRNEHHMYKPNSGLRCSKKILALLYFMRNESLSDEDFRRRLKKHIKSFPCTRFWDLCSPLIAVAQIGFLTPMLAQLGLERFAANIVAQKLESADRRPSYSAQKEKTRWADLTTALGENGAVRLPRNMKRSPELREAFKRGLNTRSFVSTPHVKKSEFLDQDIQVPDDCWEIVNQYLAHPTRPRLKRHDLGFLNLA